MREPPPPRTESELVELVRSSDVRAPDSLHRQVQAMVSAHTGPTRGRRFVGNPARGSRFLGGPIPERRLVGGPTRGHRFVARTPRRSSSLGLIGAAAVVAVVAIAFVLAGLGHSGSPALSMRQTAAPMLRAATMPAPPKSNADPAKLAAAVDGVEFPYWADRFGWHSTGMRDDRMDGRAVTTVFYSDSHGHRIGYAIVAGSPAPRVRDGGVALWRNGVSYRTLSADGVAIVSWLRAGHLCVVSGRGVSSATLLRLASWSDGSGGATAS